MFSDSNNPRPEFKTSIRRSYFVYRSSESAGSGEAEDGRMFNIEYPMSNDEVTRPNNDKQFFFCSKKTNITILPINSYKQRGDIFGSFLSRFLAHFSHGFLRVFKAGLLM